MASLNSHVNLGSDEDLYLVLARSLAQDHSFSYAHFVDEPPHKRLPPLFPLLVAPWMCLPLPAAVVGAKLLNCFAALALLWLWLRRGEQFCRGFGPLAWLGLLCSYYLMHYSHLVLSETVYALLSILALGSLGGYESSDGRQRPFLCVAAIWLLAAYFTRSIGIALFFGYGAYCLLEPASSLRNGKQVWPLLALAAVVAVAIGAWAWRNSLIHTTDVGGRSYFAFFTEGGVLDFHRLASRVGYNAASLVLAFGCLILSLPPVAVGDFSVNGIMVHGVGLAVTACITAGFLRAVSKSRGVGEYYFVCYLMIVLLWVPWDSVRFCLPILPWLLAYFLDGLLAVAGRLTIQLAVLAQPAATVLIMAIGSAIIFSHFIPREWQRAASPTEKAFVVALRQLPRAVSPEALIMSDVPHAVSYETVVKTVYLPAGQAARPQLLNYASRFDRLYVVIDPWMSAKRREQVFQLMQTIPESNWEPISQAGETVVFRLR